MVWFSSNKITNLNFNLVSVTRNINSECHHRQRIRCTLTLVMKKTRLQMPCLTLPLRTIASSPHSSVPLSSIPSPFTWGKSKSFDSSHVSWDLSPNCGHICKINLVVNYPPVPPNWAVNPLHRSTSVEEISKLTDSVRAVEMVKNRPNRADLIPTSNIPSHIHKLGIVPGQYKWIHITFQVTLSFKAVKI